MYARPCQAAEKNTHETGTYPNRPPSGYIQPNSPARRSPLLVAAELDNNEFPDRLALVPHDNFPTNGSAQKTAARVAPNRKRP